MQRLAANYPGYWSRYRVLLVATTLAAFADLLTTIQFMIVDGVEYELHPAIRVAARALGPYWGPFVGKVAQLAAIVLVTIYCRRLAVGVFVAATVMYSWAAWYNQWGREMYSPLLVEWLGLLSM